MGYFDHDITELVKSAVPPKKRSISVISFLKSLVYPLQYLASRDSIYFNREVVRAQYNGQKIVMQTALNDELLLAANTIVVVTVDDSGAGMFVGNTGEVPVTYVGNKSESGITWMGNSAESGIPLEYDFKIQVPSAQNTTDNINLITHLADRMKMAGKQYLIEII